MNQETKKPAVDSSHANDSLFRAVKDAKQLLEYCARQGIDLSPKDIQAVVNISYAMDVGTVVEELERSFWGSFQRISTRVSPITIESIKAVESPDLRRRLRLFVPITLLALLVVIGLQVYTLAGVSLLKDVKTQLNTIRGLESNILKLEEKLTIDNPTSRELESMFLKLRYASGQMQTTGQSLHQWNKVWASLMGMFLKPPFLTHKYRQLSIEGMALVDATSADLILRSMSAYVLPLWYGLLGACVYILRMLPIAIKTFSLTRDVTLHYVSRLILGAVFGVIIGLLVTPEMSSKPPGSIVPDILQSLGRPALAFIAGYSVEMVFSVFDRMLDSVINGQQRAERSTGAKR